MCNQSNTCQPGPYQSSPYECDNTYDPYKQNPWHQAPNPSDPYWQSPYENPWHQAPNPWQHIPNPQAVPQVDIPDLQDIEDWTPDFSTVWDDLMCMDQRHRLYRAIGLPCPCRDKFEKELPQKLSDHWKHVMARRAKRVKKDRIKDYEWVPRPNPFESLPQQPWQAPEPSPYWLQCSDNANNVRYQTWVGDTANLVS